MAREWGEFLSEQEYLGVPQGRRRWRSPDHKRVYEWDDVHEHIEVYSRRGKHLGVANEDGQMIDGAVKGRTIDV